MCNNCGNKVFKQSKLNDVDIEVTCPICGRITYKTQPSPVAKREYEGTNYVLHSSINIEALLESIRIGP